MRKVKIIGSGMTKFGKMMDRNLKSLVKECVTEAMTEAGIEKSQLEGAWSGNAAQGVLSGQESIRGQVVLREMGIGGIPVINVENACASSATALNGAWAMVALGEMECALVLGMEKMYFEDRSKVFPAFFGAMDVELLAQTTAAFKKAEEDLEKKREADGEEVKKKSGQRTVFMDLYAAGARYHMKKYGSTQAQFAAIAAKNHYHSTMNPLAQYQQNYTVEEVLASPEVAYPLTRLMCSPIGDGAAATIICSEDFAKKVGAVNQSEIAACVLASGEDPVKGEDRGISKLAKKAFEKAGIGPEDIDLAEVHDATAIGELTTTESLGFCAVGEGGAFAEAGHTTLGGKIPVNVSGGLECQGHPVGATGIRQVVELHRHLTNQVGKRQVIGAKVGLAQNAGGTVKGSEGALSLTILKG